MSLSTTEPNTRRLKLVDWLLTQNASLESKEIKVNPLLWCLYKH